MKCFARKAGDPNAGCFWCLIACFFFLLLRSTTCSLQIWHFFLLWFVAGTDSGCGCGTTRRGVFSTILFFAPYFFFSPKKCALRAFRESNERRPIGTQTKKTQIYYIYVGLQLLCVANLGYLSCQKMPRKRKRVLSCRNYYFYNIHSFCKMIKILKWEM